MASELAVVPDYPSPAKEFWQGFSANRGALAALIIFGVIALASILSPLIAPYDPVEQFRAHMLTPPVWHDKGTWQFVLGTDELGRDILSRLLHGGRVSLGIGLASVFLSLLPGVLFGLLAAFHQHTLSPVIMRVMDIMLALPGLLLAICVITVLGPGLVNTVIAIAIGALPGYTRLTRAAALAEIGRDYVTASRVAGAGLPRLMFICVLPNCMAPLIVNATLSFSSAILETAGLGFLGLGVQAPTPEWGTMLSAARDYILRAPWVVTLPGLTILVSVLSINLMGDGLRDALDPKLRKVGVMGAPLLNIRNLRVEFGRFPAVDGVDLTLDAGELLGIVGESGSGKSVTMLALMGLIDAPGKVTADALEFQGQDLLRLAPKQRRALIGRDIAMVFQDALSSLNPSYTIGYQIKEVLKAHLGLRGAAADKRVVELLELVEIPDASSRIHAYPHQLSGGMNQRVMIAMGIACNPKLLIADEPTTALDVTIQAQIMDLLLRLQREQGMGLVMITHDLAVVAEMAQRIAVMYAGQVVETAAVPAIFDAPRHPYTEALLAAIPEHNKGAARLAALPGIVPGALDRPAGCLLSPRCAHVQPVCRAERPALADGVRCHFPRGLAA